MPRHLSYKNNGRARVKGNAKEGDTSHFVSFFFPWALALRARHQSLVLSARQVKHLRRRRLGERVEEKNDCAVHDGNVMQNRKILNFFHQLRLRFSTQILVRSLQTCGRKHILCFGFFFHCPKKANNSNRFKLICSFVLAFYLSRGMKLFAYQQLIRDSAKKKKKKKFPRMA